MGRVGGFSASDSEECQSLGRLRREPFVLLDLYEENRDDEGFASLSVVVVDVLSLLLNVDARGVLRESRLVADTFSD